MSDEQAKATTAIQPPQDVDRVREIIFGSQMRDYQQRFQAMQLDLDRLQGEIDRLAEQLAEQDSDQRKKLQELRREVQRSDEGLRAELRQTAERLGDEKVDRLALGELFVELGTQLKTGGSLAGLLQSLAGKQVE